jgi:hypothetical protein
LRGISYLWLLQSKMINVQMVLNFISLWFKNKQEIVLFCLKVLEVSDSVIWLELLMDNLFISFCHFAYRQIIGIPMGTNCAVFLANFSLFFYGFDFLKHFWQPAPSVLCF